MKKFSLKKITAAVSAAAMIATLGTTAFAANVIQSDDSITIKTISMTQRTDNKTLYDVTVEYETKETQDIGTTMLTYVKHDDNLTSVTAYDKDTMNIVGVDQKNDASAFTFTVTTEKNSNGIYMTPGEVGLLMLSGDKVSTPAVATLAIAAFKLKNTTLGDIEITNGSAATDTAKKNAIIDAVGEATYTDSDGKVNNVSLTADNITLTETGATITYDSNSVDVTAQFVAKAFEVTGMKLYKADGSEYTTDSFQNGAANTIDTVKSKISKVIVTGAPETDGTVPTETWEVSETGARVEVNGTPVTDASTDYTVTVTAPTSGVVGLIPEGFTMPKITVEFTADPAKIVTEVVLTGADVTNNTIEVEKGTTLADALKGISFELKNSDGTTLSSEGWILSEFASTDYNAEAEGTYTATATLSGSSENAIIKNESLKTVTLTIKVKDSKPAFKYGDVDGDSYITGNDVMEVDAYIANDSASKAEYIFRDSDGNIIPKDAADVDGDGYITGNDVMEIDAYIANDAAGKEEYKFPVQLKK